MMYTYQNKGTCSTRTEVELAPDHTIQSRAVFNGCIGNL